MRFLTVGSTARRFAGLSHPDGVISEEADALDARGCDGPRCRVLHGPHYLLDRPSALTRQTVSREWSGRRLLIELDLFFDQAGADAEFPEFSADRCLAAERQRVSTSERVPAETVCQS